MVPNNDQSCHRLVQDGTNTNKTAAEIADITEKTWFTRYPLPQRIVFDRGAEFMAEFAKNESQRLWPKKETYNN